MIVVNLKTYKQGRHLLTLVKEIEKASTKILVAAQATDIRLLTEKTNLQIYAQHVDPRAKGRNTGSIIPEAAKAAGAKGTLLNHSERPIKMDDIANAIHLCRRIKLKTIVCAKNLTEASKIKKLRPDAIAFEDPALVATKKSISTYKASKVRTFAQMLHRTSIIPLCGAGISTKDDVRAAKELGCKGVLLSSAIVMSKNPKKKLQEIVL